MEVFPTDRIRNRALLTAASCLLLSLPFITRGRAVGLFLGIIWGAGAVYFLFFLSRYIRRERIARTGLPEGIRNVLKD
ncbi:MAG TPA: hypothetical protein PK907_07150, partial [Candidatus Sabulitectum sp.]|nr:hypothetical protein [Candidatus Sabulitectum sp.]